MRILDWAIQSCPACSKLVCTITCSKYCILTYRATVSAECISTFNELKIGKNNKFIIYKLSDDLTEVVVDQTSADGDWEQFRTALLDAKVTIRVCRY